MTPAAGEQGDGGKCDANPDAGYASGPHGQIHYAAAGGGEPVLLLHQTPRSWEEFRTIMEHLASADLLAIATDLPGMGASDGPVGEATIASFADAAVALLDAVEVDDAQVFGHHTGAFVGVDLAARYPQRVRSLMLSAPTWVDPGVLAAKPDGVHAEVDNASPTASGEHALTLWRTRQAFYPAGRTDLL